VQGSVATVGPDSNCCVKLSSSSPGRCSHPQPGCAPEAWHATGIRPALPWQALYLPPAPLPLHHAQCKLLLPGFLLERQHLKLHPGMLAGPNPACTSSTTQSHQQYALWAPVGTKPCHPAPSSLPRT
jgi:hypothetical protein